VDDRETTDEASASGFAQQPDSRQARSMTQVEMPMEAEDADLAADEIHVDEASGEHEASGYEAVPDPAGRVLRIAALLGAGTVVVAALYVLFAIYAGLALTNAETSTKAGSLIRIGASFSSHVNITIGICLIVSTALVTAPAASRQFRTTLTNTRTAALVAIQVLAFVLVVGSILAVRSTVYFLPALNHHLSSSQRYELTTYVVGTAGTAVLAFAAALACMPRFLDRGNKP
jgi:hypothetical protein